MKTGLIFSNFVSSLFIFVGTAVPASLTVLLISKNSTNNLSDIAEIKDIKVTIIVEDLIPTAPEEKKLKTSSEFPDRDLEKKEEPNPTIQENQKSQESLLLNSSDSSDSKKSEDSGSDFKSKRSFSRTGKRMINSNIEKNFTNSLKTTLESLISSKILSN